MVILTFVIVPPAASEPVIAPVMLSPAIEFASMVRFDVVSTTASEEFSTVESLLMKTGAEEVRHVAD